MHIYTVIIHEIKGNAREGFENEPFEQYFVEAISEYNAEVAAQARFEAEYPEEDLERFEFEVLFGKRKRI